MTFLFPFCPPAPHQAMSRGQPHMGEENTFLLPSSRPKALIPPPPHNVHTVNLQVVQMGISSGKILLVGELLREVGSALHFLGLPGATAGAGWILSLSLTCLLCPHLPISTLSPQPMFTQLNGEWRLTGEFQKASKPPCPLFYQNSSRTRF